MRGCTVDAQVISIATAVVSAAIAALGLLLNWYRREDRQQEGSRSSWLFIGAGVAIVALASVGVILTFALGTGTEDARASSQLTEDQYIAQVGRACANAKEKARRLDELEAPSVFGAANKVEEDELNEIRGLQPPDKLKSTHEELVAVWDHRISQLEPLYRNLPQLSDREIRTELAALDKLAKRLGELFRSLGLPECAM
jgi:hypothetical protein